MSSHVVRTNRLPLRGLSIGRCCMRVDRSEFLAKVPGTALNSKKSAPSTLDCADDVWGTDESHYRFVNMRDAEGKIIQREDEPSKPKKELRLIGQGHVSWDDHFVQVRVDKDHYVWYRHLPVAVQMACLGKLTDLEEKTWMEKEAERWLVEGHVTEVNAEGKPTKFFASPIQLGIVVLQGDEYVLASELKDAEQAVEDAEKVEKAAEAQTPAVPA